MRSKEDEKALVKLIAKYENLIKAKAASCMSKAARYDAALSFDDLFQAGIGGLIEAFDSFDDKMGVPFQAYISLKITYAVYNEFSRCSQFSKHSSMIYQLFQSDIEVLEKIYGRPVTSTEVADFLALPVSVFEGALSRAQASVPTFCQLNETPEALCSFANIDDSEVETLVHQRELSAVAKSIMCDLSERESFLIKSLFFEGKSLTQVGKILGVSKQRIAVLRDKALKSMRQRLPGDFTLEDILR